MAKYRITLYQKMRSAWHYCQLTASEDGRLTTSTGRCGALPALINEQPYAAGLDAQQAVAAAAAEWRAQGYDYPKRHDMRILSLHFHVSGWSGFPAGAPWFEDWKTYYQEPIEEWLDSSVNGFARGAHRTKGSVLLYYYVLDGEAARAAAERIAARAPVSLPMSVHLGDREYRPEMILDHTMPAPLAGLFEQFGAVANTVAEASQNILFHSVALIPQRLPEPSRHRIKGAPALAVRRALMQRWNFDCQAWPPLGGSSPERLLYVNELPLDKTLQLQAALQPLVKSPAYLLDSDDGLFRIAPEQLLRGAYEGAVFDASMDWIVYFSHHHTITFGGSQLQSIVQDVYETSLDEVYIVEPGRV